MDKIWGVLLKGIAAAIVIPYTYPMVKNMLTSVMPGNWSTFNTALFGILLPVAYAVLGLLFVFSGYIWDNKKRNLE
jgi:hypothetical protein